jgi:DNA-binding CsgD family transcriptional regulator
VKAAERLERDADVMRMFTSGATYAQIAKAVGLTQMRVDQIVKREIAGSARRRVLLADEALAIHQERTERLFLAHWGPALKGDHRSADICRKMLDSNARLQGLYADALPSLPAPTSNEGVTGDEDEDGNELARFRARRTPAG